MGSEYPDAIDMFVDTGRTFINAKPRGALVIHKTAGFDTIEQLGGYFAGDPSEVSSHFGVGKDGRVAQFVSLNNGAAANCCLKGAYDSYWDQYGAVNLNTVTISIEHIDNHKNANGEYDNQGDVTPEQWAASTKLCLWLRDNYNMQAADVKTHASIDPVNRSHCPGNYDMASLVDNMSSKTPVVTTISDGGKVRLNDQWYSTKVLLGAALSNTTGIHDIWESESFFNGPMGPPITHEYDSHDDNGVPVVVQEFTGGNIKWYGDHGETYRVGVK